MAQPGVEDPSTATSGRIEPGAGAVYLPEADGGFVATELAAGPWDPTAQHGGAPAALMVRAIERAAGGVPPPLLARLTVELLRPVPVGRVTVEAHVVRPGRKVQLVGASAAADGAEVARAVALLIRREGVPTEAAAVHVDPPPGPETGRAPHDFLAKLSHRSFIDAFDLRFVRGSWGPGPAAAWMRLRVPIVAGERPSPAMRVAAAADFGNGLSSVLDLRRYLFINPDLTVYLHREPQGEWVFLDAATVIGAQGSGLAESALADEAGPIGRSLQALFVDVRR